MYGGFTNGPGGPAGKLLGPIAAAGVIPAAVGANWPWVLVSVVSVITVMASLHTLLPWRRKMI
jgi:hypothetical protein